MKFGRMLAAGKSLWNGDEAGRYRMRKNMQLPQFISPKNPFAAEAVAQRAIPAEAAVETPRPAESIAPASVPAARSGQAASLTARTVGLAQRAALWCLDRNPFSQIGKPSLPAIPRFGKAPEQCELSLDKVAVVRPDLTHADLEVVAASHNSTPGPSAAWRNMTSRIFRGGAR